MHIGIMAQLTTWANGKGKAFQWAAYGSFLFAALVCQGLLSTYTRLRQLQSDKKSLCGAEGWIFFSYMCLGSCSEHALPSLRG